MEPKASTVILWTRLWWIFDETTDNRQQTARRAGLKTKTLPKLPCLIGVSVLLLTCSLVVGQDAKSITILRWALGAPQIDPLLAQTSVAKEMGYFAEGGIDVEVTPLGGGGRSVPLVASGRSEIGYIGAETMILNASKGRDPGIVLIFNQNRDPMFR